MKESCMKWVDKEGELSCYLYGVHAAAREPEIKYILQENFGKMRDYTLFAK